MSKQVKKVGYEFAACGGAWGFAIGATVGPIGLIFGGVAGGYLGHKLDVYAARGKNRGAPKHRK